MNRVKNFLIQLHNLTGTFLSLMFVVWFLSGFVLIFCGFPHASREERFLNLSSITQADFDAIQNPLASFKGRIELEKIGDQPVYRIYKGRKNQNVYNAYTLKPTPEMTEGEAVHLAEQFNRAKVKQVKVMKDLDQWMPWSYYRPLLPIFKCYLNDSKHTQLYISSKTGSILQETTRSKRWAARLGAIPHWVYFTSLRLKTGLWLKVVTWLSSFGVFVCLTGIIAGFIRLRKRKKHQTWTDFSPYKKFWHKWHHITGFFFGLFVFTFILSGLISVTDIPSWMVPVHAKQSPSKQWNQKLELNEHLNYSPKEIWTAQKNKKDIRKIVWKTVMDQSSLFVYRNDYQVPEVYICGKDSIYKREKYCEQEIKAWANRVFCNHNYTLTSIKEYNNYYQKSGMRSRPLPAWQIDLNDKDDYRLYLDPTTGETIASYNNNDRARRWLYRALHTFNLEVFKKHEWLRKLLLILASLGGLIVSLSGLVLSVRWLKRNYKQKLL